MPPLPRRHRFSSAQALFGTGYRDNSGAFMGVVERRKKWSFFVLADGTWVWRVLYPDGTERSSSRSFSALNECTADATEYGYVSRKPEEERRKILKE